MISKLLNCDPKEVTQARAAAVWLAEVNRLVREQGMSLDAAWAQVRETEPDLLARINEKPQPGEALGNSDPTRAFPTAVPAGNNKVFYLGGMRLPADTTDDEFAAAWRANGGKAAPLNAQNVWPALIGLIAGKQKLSVTDARRAALERFPALAAAAGETSAQTAAAAGNGGSDFDYGAAFAKALTENHNDPVLAHQAVMRLHGADERFTTKRAVNSPQQIG